MPPTRKIIPQAESPAGGISCRCQNVYHSNRCVNKWSRCDAIIAVVVLRSRCVMKRCVRLNTKVVDVRAENGEKLVNLLSSGSSELSLSVYQSLEKLRAES